MIVKAPNVNISLLTTCTVTPLAPAPAVWFCTESRLVVTLIVARATALMAFVKVSVKVPLLEPAVKVVEEPLVLLSAPPPSTDQVNGGSSS